MPHTPILMLCIPDFDGFPTSDRLVRPYFGMRRFDWRDHPSIEFNLTYGGWIAELGRSGFTVEALHEVQAPPDGDPGRHPDRLLGPAIGPVGGHVVVAPGVAVRRRLGFVQGLDGEARTAQPRDPVAVGHVELDGGVVRPYFGMRDFDWPDQPVAGREAVEIRDAQHEDRRVGEEHEPASRPE